jgi:hypothetical protein
MEQTGIRAHGLWQPFLTMSGMVGMINSFQVGVFAGFMTRVVGGQFLTATQMTAAFFVVAGVAHLRHQMRVWRRLTADTTTL